MLLYSLFGCSIGQLADPPPPHRARDKILVGEKNRELEGGMECGRLVSVQGLFIVPCVHIGSPFVSRGSGHDHMPFILRLSGFVAFWEPCGGEIQFFFSEEKERKRRITP